MPLSANTATVEILDEDTSRVVVKLMHYRSAVGDESDVLKVNAASLLGITTLLISNTVNRSLLGWPPFVQGEEIVGATSGARGWAGDWQQEGANSILSVTYTTAGATKFGATEVVGANTTYANTRVSRVMTLIAVVEPAHYLDIDGITWSVSQPSGNSTSVAAPRTVEVGFAGTANTTVAVLAGNGYMGKNNLPAKIKNTVTGANGSILVSTHGFGAGDSYTIILELRKRSGFGTPGV